MFDKERDGFISASELRMIFAALPEKLTEEEIEEMLAAADGDGKGIMTILDLALGRFTIKSKQITLLVSLFSGSKIKVSQNTNESQELRF